MTLFEVPDQTGRVAVITGATGGLGFRVAEVLVSKGARVIIGSRDPERGRAAAASRTDARRQRASGTSPATTSTCSSTTAA